MTTPLTPGVYVREAAGGARAIEAAPTAVTIFAGETERGPIGPTSITSATQYRRLFGGYLRAGAGGATARLFMPFAVQGFFDNGGPRAYVLRLVAGDAEAARLDLAENYAVEVGDGADRTARIRLARPPEEGEAFRIVIADATDAEAEHFNLTLQIRPTATGSFANRPLAYTNLRTADDDAEHADYVTRRLAGDPDIRWEGPVFRPVNIAATDDAVLESASGSDLAARLVARGPGLWGNGLTAAITDSADGDPERFNLLVFYRPPGEDNHDEVERFEGLSANALDEKYILNELGRSAYLAWDGDAVFRPMTRGDPEATPPGVALADGAGGEAALAAGAYPAALTALDRTEDAALIVAGSELMLTAASAAEHNGIVNAVLAYVEARPQRDLFLVADAPRSIAAPDPVAAAVEAARNGIVASDHLALYWPRIVVADPVGLGRAPTLAIPAAGHVAGAYGRTDGRRGVWKVAAGVEAAIAGAVALDYALIDREQDRMNPHGLNAIRTIPNAGRVLWGGRTRRPASEWRYINVRRTAMFLRRSIYDGIQWAVFEGNDETLWAALRQTIGAFMEAQFRNGAFAGETSREAYFVKCDSDTTTPDDQAAGIVNVQVGFAPLRPAEFVIVTLSQKTAS